MPVLRIATRRSLLARTQTEWVAQRLRDAHPDLDVELVTVTSAGDADTTSPLTALPQIGAFTRALEDALADGRADAAVHSLKDLPTQVPDGFVVAAVPAREDHRDALVARDGLTFDALPRGAVVGTGSPRRRLQLLEQRPDLDVRDIRGNVDTRIAKVHDGDYDAVVLALAGLRRIGRDAEATDVVDMLPAPGQGALGLECRAGDTTTIDLLRAVHDPAAATCVTAERAWLHATGAGCRTSAAALATLHDATLTLRWFHDGRRGAVTGPADRPDALGAAAAAGTTSA